MGACYTRLPTSTHSVPPPSQCNTCTTVTCTFDLDYDGITFHVKAVGLKAHLPEPLPMPQDLAVGNQWAPVAVFRVIQATVRSPISRRQTDRGTRGGNERPRAVAMGYEDKDLPLQTAACQVLLAVHAFYMEPWLLLSLIPKTSTRRDYRKGCTFVSVRYY